MKRKEGASCLPFSLFFSFFVAWPKESGNSRLCGTTRLGSDILHLHDSNSRCIQALCFGSAPTTRLGHNVVKIFFQTPYRHHHSHVAIFGATTVFRVRCRCHRRTAVRRRCRRQWRHCTVAPCARTPTDLSVAVTFVEFVIFLRLR